MILKECIFTANRCYKTATKMTGGKPTGIVVHSTGANNRELRRYVQPLKTDANYTTIINDIGRNVLGNHWNQNQPQGEGKCVHAFIGTNKAGVVETYQVLPFDYCCWGCGKDDKGSYNYNPTARIQFEICEDKLTDKAYFDAAFKEAIEFCAHLCKKYNLSVNQISSHCESHHEGYASNHGDPDHWLKKFGKNMDWFRAEVDKVLNPPAKPTVAPSTSKTPSKKERIRAWQEAAIKDGFKFPKYGADGAWGAECEEVAKQAIVKKRITYKYINLTKIVQEALGFTGADIDGKCGKQTDKKIREFQSANGLTPPDGAVGLNTWKKILKI